MLNFALMENEKESATGAAHLQRSLLASLPSWLPLQARLRVLLE
jgi:hypothetical protein